MAIYPEYFRVMDKVGTLKPKKGILEESGEDFVANLITAKTGANVIVQSKTVNCILATVNAQIAWLNVNSFMLREEGVRTVPFFQ